MFVGLHVLLAERTNTPELVLSEDEGKQFMAAVQNVMRHYSVQTTQKTLDFVALMGVTTGIYAPRVVAMNIRKKMQAAGLERPQSRRPDQSPGSGPAQPAAPLSIVPDAHYHHEAAE